MTLVAEPMADVSSAAFIFLVPTGAAYDPAGLTGTANVLAEMIFRGAGRWDNRTLNEKLDGLGLHRHIQVGSLYGSLGGALLADKLPEALKLYGDILRRPRLESEQFEPCKLLALQMLDSLADDPRHMVSLLAYEQYLPYPFGRPPPGKRDELALLNEETVRYHWKERFSPAGTILAAAGRIEFDGLRDRVEALFADWSGPEHPKMQQPEIQTRVFHQPYQGAQVHIGILYPSVPYAHEDYYAALAAAGVLSGGMSGRLFTEVREKRGLCYGVGAAHQVVADFGMVQCYLGSTPERAQEALDVTLAEIRRLADGIEPEELDRAKVGLRASLVMQGESTSARATSCAGDMVHLGRVRTLAQIEQNIQRLTVDEVVDHLRRFRPTGFTVATIGPKELRIEHE
ncbi:MAG: insulinase family protein [Sedimentisphaerales bacterium]|nr:insulinase family protein [Sedimentisphaerales bacterium]